VRRTSIATIVTLAALFGCFHATVETGATPSAVTVENRWASGWIFGLVPPSTISTAEQCTTGVARVETQLSFLNQLVGFLTIGIYTPMDIRVTCASEGEAHAALNVPASATREAWNAALTEAASESAARREPVDLRITR